MRDNRFRYRGVIVGCDARTPKSYRRNVMIRQTKTMWVAETGARFRRRDLLGLGDWPLYKLDGEPIEMEARP